MILVTDEAVFSICVKFWFGLVFDDAGTEMGCANRVLDGIVPNEHGT